MSQVEAWGGENPVTLIRNLRETIAGCESDLREFDGHLTAEEEAELRAGILLLRIDIAALSAALARVEEFGFLDDA